METERSTHLQDPAATGQLWPYVLAVLLLPVIVLWHARAALYSPPSMPDAWFYLGYFRHFLEYKRDLFYGLYYGSRLSWIVPGFLVHSVFSPKAADLILHLSVQSTATLSFFTTLRLIGGVKSAFLSTLVFAVYPWLWAATGTDYVDGAGIAYCLLAMALLTWAAASPRNRWLLLLAGMALAGMVYTQLFSVCFLPLLLLYYLGLHWAWRRTSFLPPLLGLCLWAGAGFGIVTAAFSAINYLLDGNFWFYASSVAQARSMAIFPEALIRPLWRNQRLVPWLWPTVAGTLAAIVLLPSRLRIHASKQNRTSLLVSAQLLLAVAITGWMQSHGTSVLGHYCYASYLLPFSFLVLGVSFFSAAEAMRNRAWLTLCGAAAIVFAALWFSPVGYITLASSLAERAAIALATCAFTLAIFLRRRAAGTVPAMLGFVVLTTVALHQTVEAGEHSNPAQYDRLIQAWDHIEKLRNGRTVRFWYDQSEPNFGEYFALGSLYLDGYSRFGNQFPSGCDVPVDPGTLVIATTATPRGAEKALSALTDCWRPWGMHPEIEATQTLQQPDRPYAMIILRAEADPALWRQLRAVFDSTGNSELQIVDSGTTPVPLPPERWIAESFLVDSPSMKPVPGGLEVHTPVRQFYFATRFAPLTAPFTGRYHFVLTVRNRWGQFAFGARPRDDSTYLAVDPFGHRVGDHREMSLWLNLKRGETVLLRTANNDMAGFGASHFVIDQLTAAGVPAE